MGKISPLASTGIDKTTGRVLSGWPHVQQSLGVIFTTFFGERVLIRWFGSFVPKILGQRMTPPVVLKFWTAVCVAVDLWEPRFKITRIGPKGTPEEMRTGTLGFTLEGVYYPRGHLGDFTADGPRRVSMQDGRLS